MRPLSVSSLITSILFGFAHAANTTAPPIPSQDPFYTQPANISLYSPGQVIRSREVTNSYNGPGGQNITVGVESTSYQYLYRTTDSLENPVAAAMTIFIPTNNTDGTKLLAYQVAEDSASGDCAPSYGFRNGSTVSEGSDQVMMGAALNNGWYVMSPDYEGLKGQYGAGDQAGHAILDAVRATLAVGPNLGLSSTARYALWGYSGGSLATEWAVELAASYAPELSFAGTAFGGTTPNVTNVLLTINDTPYSGDAFSGTRGLMNAYPDFAEYIDKHLFADTKEEFYNISGSCLDIVGVEGANKDFFSYLINGENFLYDPVPHDTMELAQQGNNGPPKMPMFIYKATRDEFSPVGDTDALVQKYCDGGSTITYQRNLNGEHFADFSLGGAYAFQWLSDRLDGKSMNTTGCSITTVALTNDDIAQFTILGEEIIDLLQFYVDHSPAPPNSTAV